MEFDSNYDKLVEQLMECDDAGIARKHMDPDLEFNLGVDAVRKLSDWDHSGDLSAIAYSVLQTLVQTPDPRMHYEFMNYSLHYVAVVCSESENLVWQEKYEGKSWTQYHDVKTLVRRTGTYKFYVREGEKRKLVTIPFYSEGFNAYLVVELVE